MNDYMNHNFEPYSYNYSKRFNENIGGTNEDGGSPQGNPHNPHFRTIKSKYNESINKSKTDDRNSDVDSKCFFINNYLINIPINYSSII